MINSCVFSGFVILLSSFGCISVYSAVDYMLKSLHLFIHMEQLQNGQMILMIFDNGESYKKTAKSCQLSYISDNSNNRFT